MRFFTWTCFAFPVFVSSAFLPCGYKNHQLAFDTKAHHNLCKTCLHSTASPEQSEAERLLKRAKELRESAQKSEHQIHKEQAEKKAKQDGKIDQLIDALFFTKGTTSSLVDRIRKKNMSIDTLEQIVDRLDEREVIAEGKEHVCLVERDGKTDFERVSRRDENELTRIHGKIDELIEGVDVLDEEFRREKLSKNQAHVSHTDDQHWGSGKRAERLRSRAHEIRRERDEQFQRRLEEFYEAQRIKKDQPPPPKAKDDHGLLP